MRRKEQLRFRSTIRISEQVKRKDFQNLTENHLKFCWMVNIMMTTKLIQERIQKIIRQEISKTISKTIYLTRIRTRFSIFKELN